MQVMECGKCIHAIAVKDGQGLLHMSPEYSKIRDDNQSLTMFFFLRFRKTDGSIDNHAFLDTFKM